MTDTVTHQRGQHLLIGEPTRCDGIDGLQVSNAWIESDYWVETKQ